VHNRDNPTPRGNANSPVANAENAGRDEAVEAAVRQQVMPTPPVDVDLLAATANGRVLTREECDIFLPRYYFPSHPVYVATGCLAIDEEEELNPGPVLEKSDNVLRRMEIERPVPVVTAVTDTEDDDGDLLLDALVPPAGTQFCIWALRVTFDAEPERKRTRDGLISLSFDPWDTNADRIQLAHSAGPDVPILDPAVASTQMSAQFSLPIEAEGSLFMFLSGTSTTMSSVLPRPALWKNDPASSLAIGAERGFTVAVTNISEGNHLSGRLEVVTRESKSWPLIVTIMLVRHGRRRPA